MPKNILITGSGGFIGRHLVEHLKATRPDVSILLVTRDTSQSELRELLLKADFIVHLAAVHRPTDRNEFKTTNHDFTQKIVDILAEQKHYPPIFFTSSIQAVTETDYGKSKQAAEAVLQEYAKTNQVPVFLYRLTNIFGKYAAPNKTSVVATFCYNTAHDLPLRIDDESQEINLLHVDTVTKLISECISGDVLTIPTTCQAGVCMIDTYTAITLGELARLIQSFKHAPPQDPDPFTRQMFETYQYHEAQAHSIQGL